MFISSLWSGIVKRFSFYKGGSGDFRLSIITAALLIFIIAAFEPLHAGADFKIVVEEKNSINFKQHRSKDRISDPWFSPDKGSHFIGSLISTIWLAKSMQEFSNVNNTKSIYWGSGLTFSLGMGKEIRDSFQPGNIFSWKDLTADCLGIGLGILLLRVP